MSCIQIPLNMGIFNTMKEKSHFKNVTESTVLEHDLWACGISLVIHPLNPHVPTTHANYRLLVITHREQQVVKDWWFGGGSDLTPIYINAPDAIHFHTVLKETMDKYDKSYYPKYKEVADEYFCIIY